MLRRIRLTNFKCFAALDLPCAPLNLLCGLNGMGKSSVIQALLVLRQSFESGELGAGRLVLGGELIDLGAGSDVLFEDAQEQIVEFELRGERPRTPGDASPLTGQPAAGTFAGLGADARVDVVKNSWTGAFGYSRAGDQLAAVGLEETENDKLSAWGGSPPFGGRLHYVQAERVGPRKLYPLSEVAARRRDLGAAVFIPISTIGGIAGRYIFP